ncbi:MAG: transposase [bacterium]
MAQTFVSSIFHIVFSTKDRLPLIDQAMRPRLYEFIGGVIKHDKGTPIKIGGDTDHLHICSIMDKNICIPDALRSIKSSSSLWIHRTYPALSGFAWQTGYGAFSISKSGVPRVVAYIDNQEEHHKTVTFQEELLEFLRIHEIPYDPKYIWE